MLEFFRKIRQKLLSAGQLSKYLIYAIGEIVLVVIGILIALQINNWNEDSKDRRKEREILTALAVNLETNFQAIESDIKSLHNHRASAIIISKILDSKLPYADSLDVHFHQARVGKSALFLSNSGYEQYKNAGFQIIRNSLVKNEVLKLFEVTYPQTLGARDMVNNEYVPFTDHHVPLFIYTSDENYSYLKPVNFPELYEDHYFIGWIKAYMEGRHTLISIETELLDETNRVLQILRDELKRITK